MNLRGNTSNKAETPTIFDCPDSAYKDKVINQNRILPFALVEYKWLNALLLIYAGTKVAKHLLIQKKT